jgi:hypothetical protein
MDNPFNALQFPDVGGAIWKSYEHSAEQARVREARRAAAAAMGGDQNALLKLYALDPAMGASTEDALYQRSERTRASEYRGALGDYMTGGGQQAPGAGQNALMGYGMPGGGAATNLAPPPQTARSVGSPGFAPPSGSSVATPGIGDNIPGNPPAASIGNRQDAMTRAMRANPEGFLTFQGKQLQVNEGQLKQLRTIHDFGMQLLGGVHDQASYDAAKAQASQFYQQHGMQLPELPPQYAPEVIHDLQMQGMETDKQLQAIVRENRLNWDMEDDRLDNARADENADSLESYRRGQLSNTRRGQDMRGNGGRGRGAGPKAPSPNSVIGRIMDKQSRGETLTPAERQTLTEYRAPRGRGRGGAGAEPAAVAANGRPIVVRGGKWVYKDSGKPVE